jgi:hypothetical protein
MKLLVHIFLVMNNQKTLVIFAFVAALGLVAIETVDILTTPPEAEGCTLSSPGFSASLGRCFRL